MIEIPDYDGMGIYRIFNPCNGKSYIGSSKNIRARIKQHIKTFETLRCNAKFLNDIYQVKKFECEIIEKIPYGMSEAYLLNREKCYIKTYNSMQCGYNMSHIYTYNDNDCCYVSSEKIITKKRTPIYKTKPKKIQQNKVGKRGKWTRRIGRYSGMM